MTKIQNPKQRTKPDPGFARGSVEASSRTGLNFEFVSGFGFRYSDLVRLRRAVLVKAIQEQQAQIEELKQKNQALVARVAPLESGSLTDTPLTADFDGDGKTDRAMVSSSGNWYFWLSGSGFVKLGPFNFGVTGKPTVGDFDGDGKADPGIVDSNGNWYVWLSGNGYSQSKL